MKIVSIVRLKYSVVWKYRCFSTKNTILNSTTFSLEEDTEICSKRSCFRLGEVWHRCKTGLCFINKLWHGKIANSKFWTSSSYGFLLTTKASMTEKYIFLIGINDVCLQNYLFWFINLFVKIVVSNFKTQLQNIPETLHSNCCQI